MRDIELIGQQLKYALTIIIIAVSLMQYCHVVLQLIANCIILLVLSSALPILARTLGKYDCARIGVKS